MHQIVFTPEFEADIRKLDRSVARRIVKKMEWIAAQPVEPGTVLKHTPADLKGLRKYRIGDYRVLFMVERNRIVLYGVEHRSSIYKRF